MKIDKSKYFQITKYEDNVIEWYLRFATLFLEDWNIQLWFQTTSLEKYIVDEYYLKIDISSNIPLVYEIGDKIESLLKKEYINRWKLHINDDNSCCLATTPFLITFFEHVPSFSEFVEKIMIPFFWWLSFYKKFCKRPNKEYSHWDEWLLEYFFELSEEERIRTINNFNFRLLNKIIQQVKPFKVFLLKNRFQSSVFYFLVNNGMNPFKF